MTQNRNETNLPEGFILMGEYSRGKVYLADPDHIPLAPSFTEKGDIVVLEDRLSQDPNLQIQNSWRIFRRKRQREIAEVLFAYNRLHPVEPAWKRTVPSMVKEWRLHNFAYYLHYKRDHTGDCDLNNADEGKGFFGFVGR